MTKKKQPETETTNNSEVVEMPTNLELADRLFDAENTIAELKTQNSAFDRTLSMTLGRLATAESTLAGITLTGADLSAQNKSEFEAFKTELKAEFEKILDEIPLKFKKDKSDESAETPNVDFDLRLSEIEKVIYG